MNSGDDRLASETPEEFSVEALEARLMEHAMEACSRARMRLGGDLTRVNLEQYLADEACVRFPTRIVYSNEGLSPHQFAEPIIESEGPLKQCRLHVHPCFHGRPDVLPYFVAYLAPVINYGPIVTPEICEAYGAHLLGMDPDHFYQRLCTLCDQCQRT